MRVATQLVALPGELAHTVGGHPDVVVVAWERVPLTPQGGDPERVDDIVGLEHQVDRLADGQVQLVGGHDVRVRVVELPPELVADYVDVHRRGRRWRLGAEDHWQRDEQDVANDNDRPGGPQDLDDRAAVDLRRQRVTRAATVVDGGPDQHRLDDHPDDYPHPDDEDEQIQALVGVLRT